MPDCRFFPTLLKIGTDRVAKGVQGWQRVAKSPEVRWPRDCRGVQGACQPPVGPPLASGLLLADSVPRKSLILLGFCWHTVCYSNFHARHPTLPLRSSPRPPRAKRVNLWTFGKFGDWYQPGGGLPSKDISFIPGICT